MVAPVIFDFLKALSANNNREWFQANKEFYQQAKDAYESMAMRLVKLIHEKDASIGAIELKDCTYRIYRDTRFSLDKTPYKTHMGTYVVRGGKKSSFAGYYLHLEPGNSFIWGGSHMPDPKVLNALREEIYHRTDRFKLIIQNPEFVQRFGALEGEKLKAAPKGFDKSFPDIDLLKYKSYGAMHQLSEKEILSDDFEAKLGAIIRDMVPLVLFFNQVIEDLV